MSVFSFEKFFLTESDKNTDYINNTSREINKQELDELIAKHCKNYDFENPKMLIYRGLGSSADYLLVSPSGSERKSAGIAAGNFYTLLFDNSKFSKDYPKRSHSAIGIQNEQYAKIYGNLYVLIPFDGASIAVCPKNDFVFCFKYLQDRKFDAIDFNGLLQTFYHEIFKEDLNGSNFNELKKQLEKFDDSDQQDFIKKKVEKLKLFFMKEFWNNFKFQNKKKLNFIDYICDTVFNPDSNGFKLIDWNKNAKVPPNKELWTESDVILIRKDVFDKIK